jgi:hypothetical protein
MDQLGLGHGIARPTVAANRRFWTARLPIRAVLASRHSQGGPDLRQPAAVSPGA